MTNTEMEISFVSGHGDALPWTFSLSLALRDVCDEVVQEWSNIGVRSMYSENATRKISYYRLTVDSLLPYKCKMGDVLDSNVLLLTEAEYNMRYAGSWD